MYYLRRVLYSAKLTLPSRALGEEELQVPFGHLGTSFAEIFGFARLALGEEVPYGLS